RVRGSQLVTGAPLGVTVVGGMAVGNSKATVDAAQSCVRHVRTTDELATVDTRRVLPDSWIAFPSTARG
ncbi:MAG TPA: hypothetical protein PK954_05785, partial [Anaerolineales bacterium]|nr:hypothetical protein [Anaerolineales bacterium]